MIHALKKSDFEKVRLHQNVKAQVILIELRNIVW